MKPRLYLETTIPSYLAGIPSRDLVVAAHQTITREWWERRKNNFAIYISQFVIDETSAGDPSAAARRIAVIKNLAQLEITSAVTDLATTILESGVIPKSAPTDAAHIANAEIISSVEGVCQAHGFQCPRICTPEELLGR